MRIETRNKYKYEGRDCHREKEHVHQAVAGRSVGFSRVWVLGGTSYRTAVGMLLASTKEGPTEMA